MAHCVEHIATCRTCDRHTTANGRVRAPADRAGKAPDFHILLGLDRQRANIEIDICACGAGDFGTRTRGDRIDRDRTGEPGVADPGRDTKPKIRAPIRLPYV